MVINTVNSAVLSPIIGYSNLLSHSRTPNLHLSSLTATRNRKKYEIPYTLKYRIGARTDKRSEAVHQRFYFEFKLKNSCENHECVRICCGENHKIRIPPENDVGEMINLIQSVFRTVNNKQCIGIVRSVILIYEYNRNDPVTGLSLHERVCLS